MQLVKKNYQIMRFEIVNNYDAILYLKEKYAAYIFRCCYIPCFDLYDPSSTLPKVGDYINGYICIKFAFPNQISPAFPKLLLGNYQEDTISNTIYACGVVKEIFSSDKIIIYLNDLGYVLVIYEMDSSYKVGDECLVQGELHLDTIDENEIFD